jgi:hypothetical protein
MDQSNVRGEKTMEQKLDAEGHQTRDVEALQAAFVREGCPVCNVVLDAMHLYMDSWQYEGFTDVEHRHRLMASRGFCPLHTWQLAQYHTAFQLALVYREVLTDVLATVKRDRERLTITDQRLANRWLAWIPWWKRRQRQVTATDVGPRFDLCPFCQLRAKVEQRLIQTLVEQLGWEAFRAGLSQATGLCLLHFTIARQYAQQTHPEYLPALLECQRTCVWRVLEEDKELIRKHDYRFEDELHGEEMTSWRRAAEVCAGNPGVR